MVMRSLTLLVRGTFACPSAVGSVRSHCSRLEFSPACHYHLICARVIRLDLKSWPVYHKLPGRATSHHERGLWRLSGQVCSPLPATSRILLFTLERSANATHVVVCLCAECRGLHGEVDHLLPLPESAVGKCRASACWAQEVKYPVWMALMEVLR